MVRSRLCAQSRRQQRSCDWLLATSTWTVCGLFVGDLFVRCITKKLAPSLTITPPTASCARCFVLCVRNRGGRVFTERQGGDRTRVHSDIQIPVESKCCRSQSGFLPLPLLTPDCIPHPNVVAPENHPLRLQDALASFANARRAIGADPCPAECPFVALQSFLLGTRCVR